MVFVGQDLHSVAHHTAEPRTERAAVVCIYKVIFEPKFSASRENNASFLIRSSMFSL